MSKNYHWLSCDLCAENLSHEPYVGIKATLRLITMAKSNSILMISYVDNYSIRPIFSSYSNIVSYIFPFQEPSVSMMNEYSNLDAVNKTGIALFIHCFAYLSWASLDFWLRRV
jgi:hypothetical protein